MLAALLAAALAPAPAFPAPGRYAYAASLNGAPVGQWVVNVKRDDERTEVDETSSASLGGMQLSAQAALLLGADLAPAKYDGNYRMLGQNPTVSVALTATSATVTSSQNPAPQSLTLGANTRHFVVVEPGCLAGLFALPAQLGAWNDSAVTWISPITGEAKILTAEPATSAMRPANVPASDVPLSLSGDIPVTMWYDPASFVPDRIAVPSENVVLTRVR